MWWTRNAVGCNFDAHTFASLQTQLLEGPCADKIHFIVPKQGLRFLIFPHCEHICHEYVVRTVMHINDGVVSSPNKWPPGAFLAALPELRKVPWKKRHFFTINSLTTVTVAGIAGELWDPNALGAKAYAYDCFKLDVSFFFYCYSLPQTWSKKCLTIHVGCIGIMLSIIRNWALNKRHTTVPPTRSMGILVAVCLTVQGSSTSSIIPPLDRFL